MIKLAYHPYRLTLQWGMGTRCGALIRLTDKQSTGYADCHPWPELTDLPLSEHLRCLKEGEKTALVQRTLVWAQFDATARASEQVLITRPLRSHYLAHNWREWTACDIETCLSEGYTHIKCKIGLDPEWEATQLKRLFTAAPLRLRLDANEKLSREAAELFLKQIECLQPQVDFIEDLSIFEPHIWKEWQCQGWRLACDRAVGCGQKWPESAAVLIIKPAVDDWACFKACKDREIIVTSYLGHPIEQVMATYVAQQLDENGERVHGLLSHRVYEPNSFSVALNWHGPIFTAPKGKGGGWDGEWEALEWEEI